MTDKLKPCPKCGCEDIGQECDIWVMASECYCFCVKCGIRGPDAPSQEQAGAAWNREQEEAEGE